MSSQVDPQEQRRTARTRLAWATLAIGLALLLIKLVAAWLTGSKAILSDALESIVNVVAAATMLSSVRLANKPADRGHPFGHGKAELLAAGFEGALLLAAATAILWEAVPALFEPPPLQRLGAGAILIGGAAVVNAVLGVALIRTGKTHASQALIADGRHLLTDVVSTIGVLLALGLVILTGANWLDPAIACAIAVWIVSTGVRVLLDAGRSLMDARRPEHIEAVARALEPLFDQGLLDPHDLRVLDAGSEVFVFLHVRVPWFWSLRRAHDLQAKVEDAVQSAFDVPVSASIQIEPCTPSSCPTCPEPQCPTRAAEYDRPARASLKRLAAPAHEAPAEPSADGRAIEHRQSGTGTD